MSKLEEKTLSSKELLKAKMLRVRSDDVLISNGRKSVREVVELAEGVVAVPFLNKETIVFIRQYRYPVSQEIIELPAGKLEEGEDPFDCIKRELTEETGYSAKEWENLGFIFTTPGVCNEKLHLYIARDLEYLQTNFDDGEVIETFNVNINQVDDMIKSGQINDAKTICAIYRAIGSIKNEKEY
ncbi:MAG: NUDIX hydrolase [Candidatus Gastranaerophilales bacterium]|nr:NUDIX hydrolase [Candidatus Gastranaerophilales bacterium]